MGSRAHALLRMSLAASKYLLVCLDSNICLSACLLVCLSNARSLTARGEPIRDPFSHWEEREKEILVPHYPAPIELPKPPPPPPLKQKSTASFDSLEGDGEQEASSPQFGALPEEANALSAEGEPTADAGPEEPPEPQWKLATKIVYVDPETGKEHERKPRQVAFHSRRNPHRCTSSYDFL